MTSDSTPQSLQIIDANYGLEPGQLSELQADTQTILILEARSFILRVQRGIIFNRWRERLEYGEFMAWCAAEFDYDYSTIQRAMNLATHFGDLPETLAIQMAGLHHLASENVEQARRDIAITLARGGDYLTQTMTYVIARAPEWVLERFLDGSLGAKQAEGLAKAVNRVSPYLAHEAEHWQVSHAAAIEFLNNVYNEHLKKEANGRGDGTLWAELLATGGWLQATEFSVHIGAADAPALEAFQSERNRENAIQAIQHRYWSKRSTAKFVRWHKGRLILEGLDFTPPSDLRAGDTVEIEFRVRRNNVENN